MEFKIDVEAEPIPQLSSTYKIYGYQVTDSYIANIKLCANANEVVDIEEGIKIGESDIRKILNVADADYSSGITYPVYRTFMNIFNTDNKCYTEIYLLGTSQKADVLIQKIGTDGLSNSESVVLYEENDGYGIVKIHSHEGRPELVTIAVDGYKYEIVVSPLRTPNSPQSSEGTPQFWYSNVENIPLDFVIEECTLDNAITHQATDSSVLVANSRTYHTNNDWVERIGTKFVAELEDQAIEMVAGAVLKLILPF